MPAPLRLGLAGLGTVGLGVVEIVQRHAELIAARAGRPIAITAVSARDRTRNRDVDVSAYAWEDDPVALARRPDVDVLVEVMGGHDGPALAATGAALAAGKDVVTANKALLADAGHEVFEAARKCERAICSVVSVAGGVPIIRALG
ncbi:MAG TPA: homoserine dehydrogenase, partial [Paracoccaceae bacterium]|nr:homoserine dehydrogenase [Paracoccaceae bacterium]